LIYDQNTVNKFRTAPLWDIRFRGWLVHDAKSIAYHQRIMRRGGEASYSVQQYVRITRTEE
jgi:hypothetical protein